MNTAPQSAYHKRKGTGSVRYGLFQPNFAFYMAYPQPCLMKEDSTVLRDLEYLQQMYPGQAKMLQKRIAEVLDKVDYEGSLLYDEYPDKWQLYRLGDSIVAILKREEEEKEKM